jgi:hypothetical protein
MMVCRSLPAVAVLVVTLSTVGRCYADSRTYEGLSGDLKAQVTFEQLGSDLKVTLSNSSAQPVERPNQVLTGVFFNILNNPSLLQATPGHTATAPDGTVNGPAGTNVNVGGEWAYKKSATNLPSDTLLTNYKQGISSSDMGIFGPVDRFSSGANLAGPDSPGGMEYGIVSPSGIGPGANMPILTNPFIKNSAVFLFPGMGGLDLKNLDRTVRFQYGAATTEPYIIGGPVPEPGTLALLGLGAAPILSRLRRRRRKA